MPHVNATGLKIVLWRRALGAELPILADGSPRSKAEAHDRPLPKGGLTPICIRTRDA